ncbi:MAG: hypothetical protein QOG97_2181 [Acidimicrobiaceae bacterium]|nr:hypothetical protein [Acidimicrobiaceae bacterium]
MAMTSCSGRWRQPQNRLPSGANRSKDKTWVVSTKATWNLVWAGRQCYRSWAWPKYMSSQMASSLYVSINSAPRCRETWMSPTNRR